MRYNTGNPVGTDGSSSPFDLHDNSGNIDIWANDRTKITSPDRLGVERKTMFGLEQQVADWLAAQGFEPVPLVYVDGSPLVVDRPTQLIQRGDNLYSVKLPASFPVTLTGTWATDQLRIVAQVDRSLRDQLASSGGATMIGRGAGTVDAALTSLETGVDDINEQLQALDSTTIAYDQQTGVRGDTAALALDFLGRSGKQGIFITPAALGHRVGRLAYRISAGGGAELISDLSRFYPSGAFVGPATVNALGLKAYYVKPGGNNASAGTDWGTALSSVSAALAKSDVDVVFVAAGVYVTGAHLGVYAGSRNVSIQAVGGEVIFLSAPAGSQVWSATGALNVFKRTTTDTVTGVVSIDHRDEYGLPVILVQRSSLTDVIANNGSWYSDGAAVYVSLPDGSAPVTDRVLYYLGSAMRVTAPNVKFHQRGITYIGGTAGAFSARTGSVSTYIISEKCKFAGQPTVDAYQIKDVGLSITIDCIGAKSGNDCFNYHALNGITPHYIEINCIGVEGSASGTGNGSTSHEGVVGFRIGCDYSKCGGPGIADVNDASSYNVACTGIGNGPSSTAYGVIGQSNDKTGAGVRVWLHSCSFGSNAAQDIAAKEGAQIFVRDTYYATYLLETGGTILAF